MRVEAAAAKAGLLEKPTPPRVLLAKIAELVRPSPASDHAPVLRR
jgi:hypothetical protein